METRSPSGETRSSARCFRSPEHPVNPPLNSIASAQNTPKFVDWLAASSLFYGRAKICMGLQFALTVPAAVISSFIIAYNPNAKIWTTFYALTAALLDALVLEQVQSYYRCLGARTQELFDCELLNLPWNELRAGARPDTEDLSDAARRFKRRRDTPSWMMSWYPAVVERLPLPLGRLICRRLL